MLAFIDVVGNHDVVCVDVDGKSTAKSICIGCGSAFEVQVTAVVVAVEEINVEEAPVIGGTSRDLSIALGF